MSATVSEKWSGKTKTRATQNGDTAQRIFTVVGAVSDDDAMNNTPVAVGSLYGSGSYLTCSSITCRDISIGIFEVTCSFSIGNFTLSQNPLTLPWKYDWKNVTIEPQIDRDKDGNPITNSARQPFSTPPTKTINYKSLRIIRNEAFYNYSTYKTYENCVNSDTITLLQPNGQTSTFAPGEMKCTGIEPAQAYTQKDQYVTIVVSLEVYDTTVISTTDPFQLHVLDQGSSGFWSNGGTITKANIWTAPSLNSTKGEQVASDVQLNGYGLPVDTTLTVQGHPPVAFSGSLPTGATIDTGMPSGVFYLQYKRYPSKAFLPLLTETAQ
jgi:hypothetical protein